MRLRLALGVVLVAMLSAAGLIFWQTRELAAARQWQAQESHSLKDLRARLRDLELNAARDREAPIETPSRNGEASQKYGRSDAVALARRDVEIGQLHKELSDAKGEAAHLRQRVAAFDEEQRTSTTSANDRYATAQTDWQNRLNDLTRQLDSAHAETEAAREKMADLSKSIEVLKQQANDASARSSETAHLLASLQDLSRRRDAYLTSVLRRYRDVTSQFRAMSGMMDSSREQASNGLSGPALTRIQSTISMAEDDLRQLNEVNAQAEQVERKLARR